MSNEQVANWLLRQAHHRRLTTSESQWLDQYYWGYRDEPQHHEAPKSHSLFWFCTLFVCGVATTMLLLIA